MDQEGELVAGAWDLRAYRIVALAGDNLSGVERGQ